MDFSAEDKAGVLVEALPYVVTILGITIYAISTFNKTRKIRAKQEKKAQKKAA